MKADNFKIPSQVSLSNQKGNNRKNLADLQNHNSGYATVIVIYQLTKKNFTEKYKERLISISILLLFDFNLTFTSV